MQQGITVEQAEWFNNRPESFASARLRLRGLASLLACNLQQSAKMIMKEPNLLDVSSKDIQRRLREVNAALGGETKRTNRVVRRIPSLLAFDFPRQRRSPSSSTPDETDTHAHHLDLLISLFCRDTPVIDEELRDRNKAVVRELCFDEPLFLSMPYTDIHVRLERLTKMLQSHGLMGSLPEVSGYCLAAPWLLTTSTDSIDRKLRSLASALNLTRLKALDLALGYPKLLTLSEERIRSKVEALCDKKMPLTLPRSALEHMIQTEPSFLMRSKDKIQTGLRTMKNTFEARTDSPKPTSPSTSSCLSVVDLVKRRASILTRNPSNIVRCYNSLSIWELTSQEKEEIFTAHPVLLRLHHQELHLRCRWLRRLVTSNGWFHSALRRVSGTHLGVIILHLPKCWSRLQYLVESNLESKILLMEAVQLGDEVFESRFPGYMRWRSYKRNEIGGSVPWARQAEHQVGLVDPDSSPVLLSKTMNDPDSDRQSIKEIEVSAGATFYYGIEPVYKPRRISYISK